MTLRSQLNKVKYAAGILHGRKAFIGPYNLQINPTNRCNSRCIYCWYRSPIRKSTLPSKAQINLATFKSIVDDARSLGTDTIILSGGGEPFLHPQIYQIIDYIKRKGFGCILLTNGTRIDKKGAERLFNVQVDKIWLNMSCGTAKSYERQHVHQSEETFHRIEAWLSVLKQLKQKMRQKRPVVSIVNVISTKNCGQLAEMVRFAERLADEVYFKPVLTIGATRSLVPSARQRDKMGRALFQLMQSSDVSHNMEVFLQQITQDSYLRGSIDMGYPTKAPCYIGWVYAEVLADGRVVTCCGGPGHVLGNVHEQRFKDIWNSKNYETFRESTRKVTKDSTMRTPCVAPMDGAVENCILFPYNAYVHQRMKIFGIGS